MGTGAGAGAGVGTGVGMGLGLEEGPMSRRRGPSTALWIGRLPVARSPLSTSRPYYPPASPPPTR